jgi:hypothetical protein
MISNFPLVLALKPNQNPMKHTFVYSLILMTLVLASACSSTKKETSESTNQDAPTGKNVDYMGDEVTGFASIEALAKSMIEALKNNDFRDYLSHTMTEKMEMEQAESIKDPVEKEKFIKEYGFSLKEEKHYFDYTIKYLKEQNIDLNLADLNDLVVVEYKGGEYRPVKLWEVIVPFKTDVPSQLDFTAIEIDGRFYLTSELGY